jgi:hypothetical protein
MQFVSQQLTGFTATDIVEEYAEYDPDETYILETTTLSNASVVRYGNYYYRSLTNNNTGFNPEEYLNIKWILLKPSNVWSMLDLQGQTKTIVNATSFYVEFEIPTLADTIGFGYLDCSKLTIQQFDGLGNVIPELTQVIENSANEDVNDYYSYIYSAYTYNKNRAELIKISPAGTKVRITFEHTSNVISIGYLVVGEAISMGTSQYGVKFGYNSYAKKDFDEYGRLKIQKRAVQNVLDFETDVKAENVVYVKGKTSEIYNDVVMFIVDESENSQYENMITLGVIQNADLVIAYPTFSTMSWYIVEAI